MLNTITVCKTKTRVTSSSPRVRSSNPRVSSSNPRVTSSNLRVTSSNPRVRGLKARVARLKARVGRLKVRVARLKARARVEAIKEKINIRVKRENSKFKILNFTSYKNFYFHCLANAELKPHAKVLRNLFHKIALTNLYVTTILPLYFSSWET